MATAPTAAAAAPAPATEAPLARPTHRTHTELPYDLIELCFLDAVASAARDGLAKYGLDNWKEGLRKQSFVDDLPNHVIKHLYEYLRGDRTEDHLGHASWGLMAMLHLEEVANDPADGDIQRVAYPRWWRNAQ